MFKRIVLGAVLSLTIVLPGWSREGFGTFSKTVIDVQRTKPPALNVPGTRLEVVVDTDRTRVASGADILRQYTEAAVLAGNKSLQAADHGDLKIILILDRLDADRRNETKTEYTSEKTKDKNGKTTYRSVPTPKDYTHSTGDIAGGYKITDARGGVYDAGDIDRHWEYDYDYRPLANDKVQDLLLKEAADKIAARIVPTHVKTRVLLPKGSFEQFIPFAESGAWDRYLAGVESVRPFNDRSSDAYREFALGIGNEMLGYNAADPKTGLDLLRKAAEHYRTAVADNPDEKLFSEKYTGLLSAASSPIDRVEASVKAYEVWAGGPAQPKATATASTRGSKTLRNHHVVEMTSAGLSDENIILAIDTAAALDFDTSPEGLVALSKAGVSKTVIAHMQRQSRH